MKDKIKHYLIAGLKAAEISSILGCSAGYISQLLKDETFKAEVEAGMLAGTATTETRMDAKYESLESKIIDNMGMAVEGAELNDLSRALDSITRAKVEKAKLRLPVYQGPQVLQQVISISVPAHALAAPVMTLNDKSEVVAIDNKPMAPLSASGVKNLFEQLQARRAQNDLEEFQDVHNTLASPQASHASAEGTG